MDRYTMIVKWLRILASGLFYVLLACWFILTVTTQSFIWRMGINVLYLFLTGVFLWSLMRIKCLIERVNTRNSF